MKGLMTPQAEMPTSAFYLQLIQKQFLFIDRNMKKLFMLKMCNFCYL